MNVLSRKLSNWAALTPEDLRILDRLGVARRRVRRHELLVREGEKPDEVFVILDGWAARQKSVRDGGRQIVGLILPGDLCDLHAFVLDQMDHEIVMLSQGLVAAISREMILAALDTSPALARALWWATLVDQAVLREWLLNIGQRDSLCRMAHLLCELYVRNAAVGLVSSGTIPFPLIQNDLGDLLGITPVHVNRTIKRLIDNALIEISDKTLCILDLDRLKHLGGFNVAYLHTRSVAR